MAGRDWSSRVGILAGRVNALTDASPTALRKVLVDLHGLFVADPQNDVQNAYRALREETLHRKAGQRRRPIARHGPRVPDLRGTHLEAAVLDLAAEIRAIDELLALELAAHHGSASGPEDWLVDDVAYLIPRPHGRAGVRDGQGYTRRGLIHHRILPARAAGHPVDPVVVETGDLLRVGRDANGVRLGSALFETVRLGIERRAEGTFVVTGIESAGGAAAVDRQVEAACADGCFAAVWPELSVPPDLLGRIEENLGARVLREDPGSPPGLVVAGSHHEASADGNRNVATVLSGYGERILRYEKVIPYASASLGTEAIVPGGRLPVLVTDEALVAFAICKDFCDVAVDVPVSLLDVDLVLIPSMGNDATMRGHQNNAKRIGVRYGARPFVVQQHDPPDGGAVRTYGYVLRPSANPDADPVTELAQTVEWSSAP